MKTAREFDIEIFKLSNKKHEFSYDLNSSFFADFENSLIENGKLHVDLKLEKSETLMIAEFYIKGFVELICDRTLETFDFEIDNNYKLIFKFGDEFVELTDEIISIPRDTQKINVAQYIYEFIGLSVPMKKLHPRFKDSIEEGPADEETLLIYSTTRF